MYIVYLRPQSAVFAPEVRWFVPKCDGSWTLRTLKCSVHTSVWWSLSHIHVVTLHGSAMVWPAEVRCCGQLTRMILRYYGVIHNVFQKCSQGRGSVMLPREKNISWIDLKRTREMNDPHTKQKYSSVIREREFENICVTSDFDVIYRTWALECRPSHFTKGNISSN
jgi:hypothetical protein